MKSKVKIPPTPAGLSKRAGEFWIRLNSDFQFEPADLKRLEVACGAMTVIDQASAELRRDGLSLPDRYGSRKAHPSCGILRDAQSTLLRALREMSLDLEAPPEIRLPRQTRGIG